MSKNITFPIVLRNEKMKLVTIVYRDHSEIYKEGESYRGEENHPYDAFGEVDMARGNGFEIVHQPESFLTRDARLRDQLRDKSIHGGVI